MFNRFLEILMPIEGKLGPVMFQFEYLNKKKMPSEEAIPEQFDGFLGQIPNGYDFAVETRNPNYLNENFFDFLKVREVGYTPTYCLYKKHQYTF
jgi:uncharacterized protein YecE (DUF72 family)